MNQTVQHIKGSYFAVTALIWLAIALPLPIFVLFMQSRGINLLQVGVAMGAYSLVIVLLELPTGGVADAIGRKATSILAQSISLASGIIMIIAFSFEGFMAAMILMGTGRALSSGALDAWFVDSLQRSEPEIDLQPPLAQAGTVTLIALGLGTLAGGFLPDLFSSMNWISGALFAPLVIPLIFSVLLKIIAILVTIILIKEPPQEPAGEGNWRDGFIQVPQIISEAVKLSSNSPVLLLLMAAALIGGFLLTGVETFWQPRFAELMDDKIESWFFGLTMALSFLVGVGGNLLSIPLSRLLGKQYAWSAFLARLGQSIALVILATQGTIFAAAGGFWFFYFSLGVLNSPHETLVNNEIPASRRSTMLSVQSLASYIGGFLGSVLIGWIAQYRSISAAWLVAAGLSLMSLYFYFRIAALLKRRE